MPTLAVVGAGPKGIAIAAKARAVAAAGLTPPRVVLIDRDTVAGNWTGQQGYTNGLLPLSTPPEKDVGFPYPDSWGSASPTVTEAMAEYSWPRHLIGHAMHADWVDRGRLRPAHLQWSCYLREGAESAEAEVISGEVVGLEADGARWRVEVGQGQGPGGGGGGFRGPRPPIPGAGHTPAHPRGVEGR